MAGVAGVQEKLDGVDYKIFTLNQKVKVLKMGTVMEGSYLIMDQQRDTLLLVGSTHYGEYEDYYLS